MAPPPLLLLQDVRQSFGESPLLAGATLSVSPGERLALVGRNGSGKSTLLRIAAGLVRADGGTRFVQPGATVRYLPQEPDLTAHATVGAYVEAALGPGDDPHRARVLLEALGLSGEEETGALSGGEARRAALAAVLAPSPDVLLLDEPTNHLDLPAIEWLEAEIAAMRGTALVLISHDRRFLERLSRATVWLDRGVTRRMEQGFSAFEAWRDTVLEEEERDAHKLTRKIAREEDWLRYGVTARRKRNVKRLGDLHALRAKHRERRGPVGGVSGMTASAATRESGTLVVAAEGVTKVRGERVVVSRFSTRVLRGDRVGIVGPNGAGKSTLLGLLTGALEPDEGRVRLGEGLEMASLDQGRASLDPGETLARALAGGGEGDTVRVGGVARHVVGYMKDWLFPPEQARTPLGALSGGERGRVMLARAMAMPSNLLVLDEPTNDLDLETLDLLQEMVAEYAGTVLVVSHDRDFLDRVATSVVAWEGEGRWVEYAGGYGDMVAQRGRGVEARGSVSPAVAGSGGGGGRSGGVGSRGGGGGGAAVAVAVAAETAGGGGRRLSGKEEHARSVALPARMEALGREVARLEAAVAAPGLYARDRGRFERFTAALAEKRKELEAVEEEWLELAMRGDSATSAPSSR